jgi:hypothetical protein
LVFLIIFDFMKSTRYFHIGSDPSNDQQIDGPNVTSFHVVLYQDYLGNVWVCSQTAGSAYSLNEVLENRTQRLVPGNELYIGAEPINWMSIFGVSVAEIEKISVEKKAHEVVQKKMNLQLVLIYLAIATILFLMAFYL